MSLADFLSAGAVVLILVALGYGVYHTGYTEGYKRGLLRGYTDHIALWRHHMPEYLEWAKQRGLVKEGKHGDSGESGDT